MLVWAESKLGVDSTFVVGRGREFFSNGGGWRILSVLIVGKLVNQHFNKLFTKIQ